MGKSLNTPQGIGIAEFRLKDDSRAQFFHKTALPGNAKFGGEVRVHPGDDLNGDLFHEKSSASKGNFLYYSISVKKITKSRRDCDDFYVSN
jgi:hypothetical protein